MKISIIVPVYNTEKYLPRCIDSIINQTYHNLEIIIINDGSTDNSGVICDEYANKDNRILVIHQQNMGLSFVRNIGLDIATGDYIGFVDSDDWIEKDMYNHLVLNCLNYKADIASIKYKLVREKTDYISNECVNIKVYENNKIEHYLESMFDSSDLEQVSCNKLYRKNLFENIRFPVNQLYEDMYTILLLIEKSNIWVVSDMVGYYYFQEGTSITRGSFNKGHLDLIKVCDQIIHRVSEYQDENLNRYAIAIKQKNYLSLLIRIVDNNFNDDILIDRIRSNLKKGLYIVRNSKISSIEKFLIYIACYNFIVFKIIVILTYKLYKKGTL